MTEQADHDLIVIGGGAGGLSVAISSLRSGLERVRVIESGASVGFPDLVPENRIDVSYDEEISSITMEGELVRIVTNLHTYRSRGCLIAVRCEDPAWSIPVKGAAVGERVSIDSLPDGLQDSDVLVVGMTNNAVEVAAAAAAAGAGVVLAAGGICLLYTSPSPRDA